NHAVIRGDRRWQRRFSATLRCRRKSADRPENAISTTPIGILPVGSTGSVGVKIAVMGSGGVGGYFGGLLVRGGAGGGVVGRAARTSLPCANRVLRSKAARMRFACLA